MLGSWWHGLVGGRSRESAPMCGTRVGTVLSPRMRQHAPEEHPRPSPRFAARFGRDLRSWMRQETARQLVELKFLHPYPYTVGTPSRLDETRSRGLPASAESNFRNLAYIAEQELKVLVPPF